MSTDGKFETHLYLCMIAPVSIFNTAVCENLTEIFFKYVIIKKYFCDIYASYMCVIFITISHMVIKV